MSLVYQLTLQFNHDVGDIRTPVVVNVHVELSELVMPQGFKDLVELLKFCVLQGLRDSLPEESGMGAGIEGGMSANVSQDQFPHSLTVHSGRDTQRITRHRPQQ